MMKELFTFMAGNVTVPSDSIGLPKVDANDQTLAAIIGGAFLAIGAVAVLFLVLGAVRYIISAGDQGAVQKAKNTILYAIVGLVISLLAFTIVQFVLGRIIV